MSIFIRSVIKKIRKICKHARILACNVDSLHRLNAENGLKRLKSSYGMKFGTMYNHRFFKIGDIE